MQSLKKTKLQSILKALDPRNCATSKGARHLVANSFDPLRSGLKTTMEGLGLGAYGNSNPEHKNPYPEGYGRFKKGGLLFSLTQLEA